MTAVLCLDPPPKTVSALRPAASTRRMSGQDALARLPRLSPREFNVLVLLAAGQTSKLVAHNLGLSAKKVELHRARVMDKMGCGSPVELGRLWEAAMVIIARPPANGEDD